MEMENCPIRKDAGQVMATTHDLRRFIRRLRRNLERCRPCEYFDDCSLWVNFHRLIDASIAELNIEWGLTEEQ